MLVRIQEGESTRRKEIVGFATAVISFRCSHRKSVVMLDLSAMF